MGDAPWHLAVRPDGGKLMAWQPHARNARQFVSEEGVIKQSDVGPFAGMAWSCDGSRQAYLMRDGEFRISGAYTKDAIRFKLVDLSDEVIHARIAWSPSGLAIAVCIHVRAIFIVIVVSHENPGARWTRSKWIENKIRQWSVSWAADDTLLCVGSFSGTQYVLHTWSRSGWKNTVYSGTDPYVFAELRNKHFDVVFKPVTTTTRVKRQLTPPLTVRTKPKVGSYTIHTFSSTFSANHEKQTLKGNVKHVVRLGAHAKYAVVYENDTTKIHIVDTSAQSEHNLSSDHSIEELVWADTAKQLFGITRSGIILSTKIDGVKQAPDPPEGSGSLSDLTRLVYATVEGVRKTIGALQEKLAFIRTSHSTKVDILHTVQARLDEAERRLDALRRDLDEQQSRLSVCQKRQDILTNGIRKIAQAAGVSAVDRK